MRLRPAAACALLGLGSLFSASCTGSGSDVGPVAPGRAGTFLRGQVEDDQGRPLVSARFQILGAAQEAVTGSSGRFLLPHPAAGTWLSEVDGRFGSSAVGTRFGRLRLALPIPAGPADLDRCLILPDLASGDSIGVTQGVQPGPLLLETAEARFSLASGSSLSLGEAGTGPLGLAVLGEADLPLPLQLESGVALATRAAVLDPPLARFEPGGALRIANSLGLGPAGTARLFRLHPETGVWEEGDPGTVSGDGLWVEAPSGSIPGGGVYLFAVARPSGVASLVTGSVRTSQGLPIYGALVRTCEGRATTSQADGSFQLGPLAGTLVSGAARQVPLVVRSGGGWAPVRATTPLDLLAGVDTPAGQLELETLPTAACQVVGALRGRALSWRRIQGGAGDMVLRGRLDGQGLVEFEDVPLGRFMVRSAWLQENSWFSGIAQLFNGNQDRLFPLLLVTADGNPRVNNVDRGIATRLFAAGGGAPLAGVEVFIGRSPNILRSGVTDEYGLVWLSGLRGQQVVTAYRLSRLGDRSLKAVVTLDGVDSDSFDLGLPILTRSAGSEFLPFGELQGSLTGAGGGDLAVTGRSYLDPLEVESALLQGLDLDGEAPLRSGPPDFIAGIPAGRGTLVGSERQAGRLVRMGLGTGLELAAGTRTPMDLALSHQATATVRLEGALGGLDGRIDSASVSAGLGFRLASGEGLLVGQGLVPAASGPDLQLQVPALEGALAGASRMIALAGSADTGGVSVVQRALVQGEGDSLQPLFLAVPSLVRPQPGGQVDPAQLVVEWGSVPTGTTALRLQLRWTVGAEEGSWDAWVRPDRGSFAYFPLPQGAFTFWPTSGTELHFTLTCYRLEGTFLAIQYSFDRLMGALAYAEPERLGVTALAALRFSTIIP